MESKTICYAIEGMDCADCALTLEHSVSQLPGVETVTVNFGTALLEASGEVDPQTILGRVTALGYKALPPQDVTIRLAQTTPIHNQDGWSGFLRYLMADRQRQHILAGFILLLLSALLSLLGLPSLPQWLNPALQSVAMLLAGYPIANKGLRALLIAHQMTIDLLMTIAAVGALLIGETGEAATVILLFAIGEALEGYTVERSRRSLHNLLALTPDTANVLRPCMDCAEHLGQNGYTAGPCPICGQHPVSLPVEQVGLGDLVLVRPGERIPVDGYVTSGFSAVNQAPVTGESLLVAKHPGDEVYAGTLNGIGALEINVTRMAEDSTISRIVRLVEQAQAQRAPIERFINRFARYYTPAVVGLAVLLATLPPLLLGAPFFDTPDGEHGWLYRSLAILIIACPCALAISTPVTIISAISGLARRGVLVKGGIFLEGLAGVKVFAFDKTGTLTHGRPQVTQVVALDCLPDTRRCAACDDMLALAAAIESRSQHPLAQAIVREAELRNLTHSYPQVHTVQTLTGQGLQGFANDWRVTVGNHDLFHSQYDGCERLHTHVFQAENQGKTVMLVGRNDDLLGFLSVADVERPSSRAVLAELKAIDPHLLTVMLTGDNPLVAEQIAAQLGGIDLVRAGLLPDGKVEEVNALQNKYGPLAMLGDGVNDAPALAASTIGIAMGGAGSAQAMETADIVLMQDDLHRLPDLLRTSRRTKRVIWQNIIFSLALKGLFLLLSLFGATTLWMAVFADMGASLLVTLNGMRLLNQPGMPSHTTQSLISRLN